MLRFKQFLNEKIKVYGRYNLPRYEPMSDDDEGWWELTPEGKIGRVFPDEPDFYYPWNIYDRPFQNPWDNDGIVYGLPGSKGYDPGTAPPKPPAQDAPVEPGGV